MKVLYSFRGKVISGAKRGKNLGFPTANMRLHKQIPEGIYAAKVKVGGKLYMSATFIGISKTFGEKEYKAENFLLNFSQNIYGKWLSIRLYKKMRDNQAFPSVSSLIAQMTEDIKKIQEYFASDEFKKL